MFTAERGMLAARVFAVVVIVGVGAAAFRLSFATLRDLAESAHIPASDAYLFPLIVDGTIVQATLGWLVLAKSPERKFFVRVLIAGAVVSVAGNSLHAVAAGKPLAPWVCAVVAAIAPISLLLDTHGLAVLFRAAQRNSASSSVPAVDEPADQAAEIPVAEPDSALAPESMPVATAPALAPVAPRVPVAAKPRPVAPVRPVRPPRPVQQDALPFAVS
ncbi:DUF2637 domain-containing protein [Nocardia wallacei]|uniref:DUF2637 domain-containing protein n=1 Tax=Nocardia wallacei TaxID=480035 RepID=UPI002457BC27|nr:DUF2637 domain-containing protein [Nocardia wallacei]